MAQETMTYREATPGAIKFPELTVDGARDFLMRRDVQVGIVVIGLLFAVFGDFSLTMLRSWFNVDSYYQHGPAVPLAIGYILYVNRDRIEKHPIKPTIWPILILIPLLIVGVLASWAFFFSIQGAIVTAALGVLAWMFYGLRRAWAMAPAVLFAMTGLPMWNDLIDRHTNQLQIWSTDGAYALLKIIGQNPIRMEPTVIHLDRFELYIAAACSGMKLTLAMLASVIFVLLVARLKWWGNLILVAMALPLAVVINGLRIGVIGIVGNNISKDAGHMFHDYGSYIFLVMAFAILYYTAKKLGWKV